MVGSKVVAGASLPPNTVRTRTTPRKTRNPKPLHTGFGHDISAGDFNGDYGDATFPAAVEDPKYTEQQSPTVTEKAGRKRQLSHASKAPRKRSRQMSSNNSKTTGTALNLKSDVDKVALKAGKLTESNLQESGKPNIDGAIAIDSSALQSVPVNRKPAPARQPTVWANTRVDLCETLPYYRSYQGSAYHRNGQVFGFLLAGGHCDRSHFDEQIIITRSAGHMEKGTDGKMSQQKKSVKSDVPDVAAFEKTMDKKVPIIMIVAKTSVSCPVELEHEYNVMGHFIIAKVWAEKNDGMTQYRFKLQALNLKKRPWWAIAGSSSPPPAKYEEPCMKHCSQCGTAEEQVYQDGWMCLQPDCSLFWKIEGGMSEPSNPASMKFSTSFLSRRIRPGFRKAPYLIAPSGFVAPEEDAAQGAAYSRAGWRGNWCNACGCCAARRQWPNWQCSNCCKVVEINQPAISARVVQDPLDPPFDGHALDMNNVHDPAYCLKTSRIVGWYAVSEYDLGDGMRITVYQANDPINKSRGGADDMFLGLQKAGGAGLKRFPIGSRSETAVYGGLTNHFSVNFGMPYSYIVKTDSQPFKAAPREVLDAVKRCEWAGKEALKGRQYQEFNECLLVGYFAEGKMSWHDDGEDTLGDTVATLSLGGKARMRFRMKKEFFTGRNDKGKWLGPGSKVPLGSQLAKERIEINERCGHDLEAWNSEMGRLREDNQKRMTHRECPAFLDLELRHGDMCIMTGSELQQYYEHIVESKDLVRIALTCRHVLPEKIDRDAWHLGELPEGLAPYDGLVDGSPPGPEDEDEEEDDELPELVQPLGLPPGNDEALNQAALLGHSRNVEGHETVPEFDFVSSSPLSSLTSAGGDRDSQTTEE